MKKRDDAQAIEQFRAKIKYFATTFGTLVARCYCAAELDFDRQLIS